MTLRRRRAPYERELCRVVYAARGKRRGPVNVASSYRLSFGCDATTFTGRGSAGSGPGEAFVTTRPSLLSRITRRRAVPILGGEGGRWRRLAISSPSLSPAIVAAAALLVIRDLPYRPRCLHNSDRRGPSLASEIGVQPITGYPKKTRLLILCDKHFGAGSIF